ncbi:LytR family transcriptional attenuator [Streptomyces sp. TLI_235]|nr:LCP family protein [Streptomyces sp. TLI_235]PBC79518.1 LytR family transcriptional attenuator [Streptomyces sp. TLI_235]
MTSVEPIPGGRAAARRARQGDGSQRRPRRRRWLRIVAITTGATVVAGCGAGYLYYQHLNGNIRAGTKNLTDEQGNRTAPDAKGRTPLNILMIGTDSRGSAENVALGGSADEASRPGLADVQMLLHVSADRTNASMISIPRDTMVTIPTCHDDKGKTYKSTTHTPINEALSRGGPGCVLGTWIGLTGLDIDHYMMVDFGGVVRMADAIGGVPVCVDRNMWDRYRPGHGGTDLKLPKGTTKVKGEDALKWLRTRDAWGSDIGRTKAQHMYLSSMTRELKASGRLSDPGQLMSLAEAATKSLSVDNDLADLKKLYDLGNELKQVPTERTTTLTVPVIADPQNPSAKLLLKQPDVQQIWKMLLADAPLDDKGPAAAVSASPTPSAVPSPATGADAPAKSTVVVTVQNGTGVTNRAADIKKALVAAGFTKAATAPGGGARDTTRLTYGAGQLAKAQAVAATLGLPASALVEAGTSTTLSLVIGADWKSGTTFAPATAPTALPTSVESDTSDNDKNCMTVVPQGGLYTY